MFFGGGFGRGGGWGGRGNPYLFCRFYPWLPRRWWAYPQYAGYGAYPPVPYPTAAGYSPLWFRPGPTAAWGGYPHTAPGWW